MARAPTYDLRLYGRHKLVYRLIPYDKFHCARATRDAEALVAPVMSVVG